MAKIVCLSDTHEMHHKVQVPDGDILIHAGDFCGRGLAASEVGNFLYWLDDQPHETKIVVPGNHDVILETDDSIRKEFEKSGVHLLIDEEYTNKSSGLKFYGVPWTPDFYPDLWGFQSRNAPLDYWDRIPEDTDVLISHGPPFGAADQIDPGNTTDLSSRPKAASVGSAHLGCKRFASVLSDFASPLTIICGHIHGSYGKHFLDHHTIYNVSICTELYIPSNTPTVLEL